MGPGPPRLTHRSSWLDHDGELPLIEGTLIRLKVEHLSKERDAPPLWLWSSKTGATPADVDRFWQAFLRRFGLEHTFRFAKQTLGWTTPKLRIPEAADRWTWILIVAHTQLRLARPLAADLRRPWEKPTTSDRLTPARVRRGFRNIRAHLACPTRVPKPRGAGPGKILVDKEQAENQEHLSAGPQTSHTRRHSTAAGHPALPASHLTRPYLRVRREKNLFIPRTRRGGIAPRRSDPALAPSSSLPFPPCVIGCPALRVRDRQAPHAR